MNLEAFTAQGWRAQRHTLTAAQTYLWGSLSALPFVLLAGGLYRMLLFRRAVLLEHTGLILLAVIVISVPLHEALHGLGWKLAGRLQKGDVAFFLRGGIPMCACRTVLPAKAYLIGTLLPFLVLGGGSFLLLFLFPGTVSVLEALVNLMLPGADLAISWRVLKSEAALIADSPDGAGFIGLVRMLKTFEKITSFYWIMGRICAMLKWIAIAGPYRVFSAFIHRLKRVKTDKEKARESL